MSAIILNGTDHRAPAAPAERLRISTTAVRVSIRWLGTRKTLTAEQRSTAAEPFGAEGEYLSARKKILDTAHPSYKEVTAVRGRVISFWKSMSLPYPEPAVRLIKQDKVETFNLQMLDFRGELDQAVRDLDEHYGELRDQARKRLGDLFNGADYPSTLVGLFGLDWDHVNLEPPPYLLQLSPAVYELERQRVAAKFEQAVELTEQAFISEFGRLVAHLAERLSGDSGEKKVFRDTAIGNLTEFFERFRSLSVGSSRQLDDLVEEAKQVVQGVEPQELRDDAGLRQHIATQMSVVQSQIDQMMVSQPRRRIVRAQREAS